MPFTPTVLDNFDRANANDPGANWGNNTINAGVSSTFNIASNALRNQLGSYCEQNWDPTTPAADAGCVVTITALGVAGDAGYGGTCRVQSPATAGVDCYRWQQSGGNMAVLRVVNGVESAALATAAHTMVAGDTIACIPSGSGATVTVKVFRDRGGTQTELLSYADTHADRITSAGKIGLWVYDTGNGIIFEDFGSAVESGGGDAPGPNCFLMTAGGLEACIGRTLAADGLFPPVA